VIVLSVFLLASPRIVTRSFKDQRKVQRLEMGFLEAEYSRLKGDAGENGDRIEDLRLRLERCLEQPLVAQMRKSEPAFDKMAGDMERLLGNYLSRAAKGGDIAAPHSERILVALKEFSNYMYKLEERQLMTIHLSNSFVFTVILILSLAMVYTDARRRRAKDLEEGLRQLNRKNLKELEEGRKRINYQIHDHVLQDLEMVRRNVETCSTTEIDEIRREETLERIRDSLSQGIYNLRKILEGLPVWDTSSFSLRDNIEVLVERAGENMKAEVRTSLLAVDKAPLATQEIEQLLSILQEALFNAAKHAGAATVTVKALYVKPVFRLIVEDDGIGFTNQYSQERKGRNLGLLSMQERARSIGADFTVESRAGWGTTVSLELVKE
jgi:signal transduction histidine kinase